MLLIGTCCLICFLYMNLFSRLCNDFTREILSLSQFYSWNTALHRGYNLLKLTATRWLSCVLIQAAWLPVATSVPSVPPHNLCSNRSLPRMLSRHLSKFLSSLELKECLLQHEAFPDPPSWTHLPLLHPQSSVNCFHGTFSIFVFLILAVYKLS